MNPETNPGPSPAPPWQNQWVKIAFGIVVLIALAWLNTSTTGIVAPRNEVPTNRSQTNTPPSTDEPQQKRSSKHWSEDADDRPSNAAADETDSDKSPRSQQTAPPSGKPNQSLIVRNVRVVDEDGNVVYRGDIDLEPTLERIEEGTRLPFSHDGIVFENRERRLPLKPNGYYHEFVQPTPHERGPGGQRVVLGRNGEVYYSSDHYRTFQRVR